LQIIRGTILNKFYSLFTFQNIELLLEISLLCFDRGSNILADDHFFDKIDEHNFNGPDIIELQNGVTNEAMYCYLDCLFKLQTESEEEKTSLVEKCLISSCKNVINIYMGNLIKIIPVNPERKTKTPAEVPKNIQRITKTADSSIPLLLLILEKILEFNDAQFLSCLESIYPLICDLTNSTSQQVRMLVRQVLWRIGNLCILKTNAPFISLHEKNNFEILAEEEKSRIQVEKLEEKI